MDLLFKRYANPFILLDSCILTGRLTDFILEFIDVHNDETMWDVWIHRVHDKSFEEFKNSCSSRQNFMSDDDLETTIKDSKSMLNNFIPN